MDLATELGEQGFRWIFVLQNHGSPVHNLMIDQAGDYFHDTYGGQMVNLTGLEPPNPPPPPPLSEEVQRVSGIDVHAGLSETSRILFIRPGLVHPGFAQAPLFTARTPPELGEIAKKDGWPGYFGAPHLASAAYGAKVMRRRADILIATALEILGGKDPRSIPRYATTQMKLQKETMDGSLAYDESVRKKQAEWLAKNGIE